jgi:hypothetical protein
MGGVGAAFLPEGKDRWYTQISGDVPQLKNSKSFRKYYEYKFQSSKLCRLYFSFLENRLNCYL